MNRCSLTLVLSLLTLWTSSEAFAQVAGLVSQHDARRVGLQRVWFAQAEIDPGRGRLVHLSQHVSSTNAVTVYQIKYDGGRYVVSGREVDRFGALLGPENAKKLAQVKYNDLKNLNLNPKLEMITVPQITLYAVSDTSVVQAIDSETGRTIWKSGIGIPHFPTEAVGASDEFVAVVNGSDLYLMKATNGEIIWKRRVDGAPGAGPVISPTYVFVPMLSGAMEAYSIDNTQIPPSIYRSQGRAMFQPVYTGANVAWTTDRGHLYVTGAIQNKISFRLEANDAIAAPATVMHPGKLLVTSIDGFVYCLQETSGGVLWRFSAGEPIMETPTVYGNSVYAVTSDGTLFAIDGEYGQEQWSMPGMSKVVGASTNRLYCLNETRQLVILDQKTGSQLGSLTTETYDVPYINKETDRIILANGRGLIQCFREVQQEYPLIHIALTKKEEAAVKVPKKPAKPAEAAPGGESPFGDVPAEAPKKEEAPPADDTKKGDDPFGE